MLNPSQIEFLESLVSVDGDYYLTIKEYSGLSVGGKVLYLKRALEIQDPEHFLVELDKLFQPDAHAETVESANNRSMIEFICAFKGINGLFFDSPVPLSGKSYLEHYFGSYGDIGSENKQRLKAMIKHRMGALMTTLQSLASASDIERQQEERLSEESTIVPNMIWRTVPFDSESSSYAMQAYWGQQRQQSNIPCNMMVLGLFMTVIGALGVAMAVLWTPDRQMKVGTGIFGMAVLLSGVGFFSMGYSFNRTQHVIGDEIARTLNA